MRFMDSAPLTDDISFSVARLVDDAQAEAWREPSHSTLEFLIKRARLTDGDPHSQGQEKVGKRKRVLATLSWAIEHNRAGGEEFIAGLISSVRSLGGFRPDSRNYVGDDPIQNAIAAFRAEGYELSHDGTLRPTLLGNLSGMAMTEALGAYVRRAKLGAQDAALLTGTGKDLLEATAAHVVIERFRSDPGKADFPTLLAWAFKALNMATPKDPTIPGEPAKCRFERALFEVACSINVLRNKHGTGHGRAWLPGIADSHAKSAVELMGCIAERLLSALKENP
jgi:hypothetical protein